MPVLDAALNDVLSQLGGNIEEPVVTGRFVAEKQGPYDTGSSDKQIRGLGWSVPAQNQPVNCVYSEIGVAENAACEQKGDRDAAFAKVESRPELVWIRRPRRQSLDSSLKRTHDLCIVGLRT